MTMVVKYSETNSV